MSKKQTILLAEDDENVRNIAQLLLENFGYEVVSAIDGEDALVDSSDEEDRSSL